MGKNRIIALFTVFLTFILIIAMKPGDDPVVLVRIASIVAVIIFIGMILYTRLLWRIAPFNKLHKVIDVGGKWQGKMILENGASYNVDTVITQYLDEIKIKIKTDNFLNDSLVCKMSTEVHGSKLYAVYKSRPNGKVDSKDQIEYGTFIIDCDEDLLEGLFFTSNKLSGKLELYRR